MKTSYFILSLLFNSIVYSQCGDVINPTASNPSPIIVNCASDVPAPDPGVVTDEADNSGVPPTVTYDSSFSDGNVCSGETITRTYAVTDTCGNFILVTQEITILVTTPFISAGVNQDVCESTPVTLTASNPDGASITWSGGVNDGVPFYPSIGTTTFTAYAEQCGGECYSSDQVDVVVNENPYVIISANSFMGCAPFEVQFDNLTSSPGIDCQWDFGDGNIATGCSSVTNTFNTDGMFTVSLTVTSIYGCMGFASYVDYIEVFPEINATISMTGSTLTANPPGDFYEWVDCNNGMSTIPGENNQDYTPVSIGDYAVVISTFSGCSDTSDCFTVVGIEDYKLNDLFVFSNPVSNELRISSRNNVSFDVQIVNMNGEDILTLSKLKGDQFIDLTAVKPGTYVIRFVSEHDVFIEKLIVQ